MVVTIFMLPNFAKILIFFFSRALPVLISFCPEAWGETCHRVDTSIWETHRQCLRCAAVCSSSPHPPGSPCFVTTRLLFGRTGQDGTCLHWRRGRLNWLPSPAPPTAPPRILEEVVMSKPEGQVVGQGGPHASLLPLPQPPSWPPKGHRRERVPGIQPGRWCRCARKGLRHHSSTKQRRQWIQVV